MSEATSRAGLIAGVARRRWWRRVEGRLGVAVAAASQLLLAATGALAASPTTTLEVKAAAEAVYAGEPVVVFAVLQNKSDSPSP